MIHSGTVGAALTAANHGIPAMAVSLDVRPAVEADPATNGEIASGLLSTLDKLPANTILNVNVPNRAMADLRGVRQAALAPFGQVQMSVGRRAKGSYGPRSNPPPTGWSQTPTGPCSRRASRR